MIKAKDIMTRKVITVTPETEVGSAANMLLENRVNGLLVVDKKGRLIGVLCQSDLVAQQKRLPLPSVFTLLDGLIPLNTRKSYEKEIRKIAATKVEEAMTPNPLTVSPDTGLEEIATLMVERNFHTIPVVDQGELVGVIGKEDVLKTLMPLPPEEHA